MEFTVKIKCDNEAIEGGPTEVVRLLRDIANRISADYDLRICPGERAGEILDYNGNSVGAYEFGLDKRGK